MSNELEQAQVWTLSGKHAEAAACYEAALADPKLAAEARAHFLAHLADSYVLLDRLEEALNAARQAVQAAGEDQLSLAAAAFSLGRVLLFHFELSEDGEQAEEALELLGRAADIYRAHGRIEYMAALLAVAEASRRMEELETAANLFFHVVEECSRTHWTVFGARTVDGLRGRGQAGMAYTLLMQSEPDQARSYLEAATHSLLAAGGRKHAPDLMLVADVFEQDLEDEESAQEIRKRAQALLGSDPFP